MSLDCKDEYQIDLLDDMRGGKVKAAGVHLKQRKMEVGTLCM